jgi:hypothetical protein
VNENNEEKKIQQIYDYNHTYNNKVSRRGNVKRFIQTSQNKSNGKKEIYYIHSFMLGKEFLMMHHVLILDLHDSKKQN